jgi:putative acetyltransferase
MGEMEIVDFRPEFAAAFRALNEAWIKRYFALEPRDREVLGDPAGKVIALQDGCLEVAKMAVTEAYKGRGVGRELMAACVARARQLGVSRLYLETNSGLAPALGLYRSFGFEVVEPAEPSPYARADVAMELLL